MIGPSDGNWPECGYKEVTTDCKNLVPNTYPFDNLNRHESIKDEKKTVKRLVPRDVTSFVTLESRRIFTKNFLEIIIV